MNSQGRLIWTNELSIGNPAIDDEHKKLIEIYNDLLDLEESKGNRRKFAMILSKMTDYSLTHFRKEEKYMERFSYPKLNEHKKSHLAFIYKVTMYNNELSQSRPLDLKEIIAFIGNGWLNHIQRDDKEYECYKNKIGSDVHW